MDNALFLPCDASEVSDGYHTFAELYNHRCLLFINLAVTCPGIAFKTRRNDVREEWEGWFILGLNTPHGQITYHIPSVYWDLAAVPEIDHNADYDGHSSNDVVERLRLLALNPTQSN